ncbi:hypothetical protein QBC43DRAFT_359151 [Cladorrhinum sp. PSN259]|nr:hypothetical protein QBC43DRAFT_359151 [Cladorrhinum sp. PSN259]
MYPKNRNKSSTSRRGGHPPTGSNPLCTQAQRGQPHQSTCTSSGARDSSPGPQQNIPPPIQNTSLVDTNTTSGNQPVLTALTATTLIPQVQQQIGYLIKNTVDTLEAIYFALGHYEEVVDLERGQLICFKCKMRQPEEMFQVDAAAIFVTPPACHDCIHAARTRANATATGTQSTDVDPTTLGGGYGGTSNVAASAAPPQAQRPLIHHTQRPSVPAQRQPSTLRPEARPFIPAQPGDHFGHCTICFREKYNTPPNMLACRECMDVAGQGGLPENQ